jgi:hypothetical protein
MARVAHTVDVKVLTRSESGQWVRWRVRRRCLVWAPSYSYLQYLELGQDVLIFVVWPVLLARLVLTSLAVLVATAVMWPVRVISGRWPVVAYLIDTGSDGEDRTHLVWVRGREEADALVRQWAADIKKHGRPRVEAAVSGPAERSTA